MATAASNLFSTGGLFNGLRSFRPMAGKYFIPAHLRLIDNATTAATTAARYYIVPFIVEHNVTYAGAWCYNGGAGDNGDKVKIAAYSESASGGPGVLANNFGEVTLTGAAAVRNFASSWSPTPGRYYLELVTDNPVTMYLMGGIEAVTTAGVIVPNIPAHTMGMLSAPLNNSVRDLLYPVAEYVGGTYANFPESNSLTPTNTISSPLVTPAFGLYT